MMEASLEERPVAIDAAARHSPAAAATRAWPAQTTFVSWSRSTWITAAAGIAIAAAAMVLRLTLSAATGGEQTIFSFPAIVAATLLFGMRAGATAALVCLAAWWYFVLPPVHSFHLAGTAQIISVLIYLFVAGALIWAIGGMRLALVRARMFASVLERLVERRTAERDRGWARSRELVAIVADDGAITAMNPALTKAATIAGHLSSTTFLDLIPTGDRPRVRAALQALREDDAATAIETRLDVPGQDRWIEWTAKRELGQIYVVGHDFTAEHDCSEHLRQSQKMEMVGQMTGGLVHDFANLLSPIVMVLDLLRQRHEGDARTDGLIAAAQQSTGRAEMLVRRLLRFSRQEQVEPRTWPAGLLIEQVVPLLRQVLGNRTFDVTIAADLPQIRVDPNEFDLALLNLAVNARDATDDTGHVRLNARRGEDNHLVVAIEDDGAGMDAATLAHARDPFFTTKGREHGTGLGLPMAHNFAVGAGGGLVLESAPGNGTTALIVLPPTDKAAPMPASPGDGAT